MSQSAPGRSARPTEPAKSTSPEKRQSVGVEGDVGGRVAGNVEHLEGDARRRRSSRRRRAAPPACARGSRPGRCPRTPRGPRAVPFPLGHVDGRSGALGQPGDADEVVPVAVRDEDRGAARAHATRAEGGGRPGRRWGRRRPPRALRARRARRSSWSGSVRAGAVRRRAPRAFESNRGALGSLLVESWDLTSIETPGGTRLASRPALVDEARAVVIGIEPGQELGDHQVKERAWVVVVEGTVEIECDGRTSSAATRHAPHVRARTSATRSGAPRARAILLILAPWPGEGHYRGGGAARAAVALAALEPLELRPVGQPVDPVAERDEHAPRRRGCTTSALATSRWRM